MPVYTDYSAKPYLEKCKKRKAKKDHWIKKGCSERKAETLLFRYGY